MKWSNHLANVEFYESKQQLLVTVISNIILMLILIASVRTDLWTSPHAQFSLLSAIFIFAAQRLNDWRNQIANFIILGFYLALCIMEVSAFGLPNGVSLQGSNPKGILFKIIVGSAPLMYIVARFFATLPILNIILKRRKFQENKLV